MNVLVTQGHSDTIASQSRTNRGILGAFVDKLAGLEHGFSTQALTTARGLFWFSLVAGLLLPVLIRFDRAGGPVDLFRAQLQSGMWFVLATIMVLRITKSTSLSGIWIGAWAFITIGAWPLYAGDVDAMTLLLLALLPILFGLTAGPRACFASLFCVLVLYLAIIAQAYLLGSPSSVRAYEFMVFCAFSSVFSATTVAFFARVTLRETKALTRRNQDIRAVALTDALTRTRNRHAFQFTLDKLISENLPGKRPAMLILDLDGFKLINDTYGHDTGDDVLKVVANRVRTLLQTGRTLYRLGGDEFAVVCANEISEPGLLTLANRLASAVSEPIPTGAGDVNVTVSIGVAIANESPNSLLQLYRRADNAAFAAKERSGPSVELFSTELDGKISRKIEIESG
ncbi:MAG: GGDEF domain-containing protein, partial [Pseudomonadota bacterium]